MSAFTSTRVLIPGSREYGTLRYVGPIEGKNGTFCGLELSGTVATIRGKNSGSVDGVQYFDVAVPGSGLFVPFDRLKSCNPHLQGVPSDGGLPPLPELPRSTLSGMQKLRRSSARAASPFIPLSAEIPHIPRPTASRKTSLTSARITSAPARQALAPSQTSKQDLEILSLKRQIAEMKAKHEREIDELTSVLENLQQTAAEGQAFLDEYEVKLSERDAKLARQKADFDMKREEWRKSMDMLVAAQQENELYFEQEIKALQYENQKLRSGTRDTASFNDDSELYHQLQIEDLQKRLHDESEKNEMALAEKDREIRSLKDRTSVVANGSFQSEITSLKAEKSRLVNQVIELKEILAEKDDQLTKAAQGGLVDGMKSLSVNSDESRLKDQVEQLEHELDMRPSVTEMIHLQDSMDELVEEHKKTLEAKNLELEKANEEKKQLQDKLNEALAQQSAKTAPSSLFNIEPNLINGSGRSAVVTGSLPVYKLPVPIDPGAGKDLWCALCDRDGHSSIACPYDQDVY